MNKTLIATLALAVASVGFASAQPQKPADPSTPGQTTAKVHKKKTKKEKHHKEGETQSPAKK
jgi:hypothetical protein